jgi:hypothetical protein
MQQDAWIIHDETTLDNQTLHLDRPLYILPGGQLALTDMTLVIADGGSLLVAQGGRLSVHDSRLLRAEEDPYWSFEVYGLFAMNNSEVKGSQGIKLRHPGTMGSHIAHSHFHDHPFQAVHVINRGELTFTNNTVTNGFQGIRSSDATIYAADNTFLDHTGYAVNLVSTLAGSRAFGPSIATFQANVIADGHGGIHIQEDNNLTLHIQGNLLTNLHVGLRVQENDKLTGHVRLVDNSILANHLAAVNFGRSGERALISETAGHQIALNGNWLGPEGATWEEGEANRLVGPFHAHDLLSRDPVPHLWDRLDRERQSTHRAD